MPSISTITRDWLRDRGVVRRVKPFGVSWTEDLKAIGPAPSTIFDVGGNVGQTAEECARAFPGAAIYSFEPAADTFATLKRNVAPIAAVTPVNVALSDHVGEGQMTEGLGGENSLGGSHRGDAASVTVKLDTVDTYMKTAGVARVDLLKMDVEGHELQVLAGATAALGEGGISFVLSETDFRREGAHTDLSDLRDVLEPYGFRVASFYGEGIDAHGWIWGDVLFVREGLTPAPVYDTGRRRIPIGYRKSLLAHRPGIAE
jgi:FkbM family methyltransferase